MAEDSPAHSILVLRRRRRGQPPRAGVRSSERVEFVLTLEERRHLERVAREEGRKLATVIRDAVNSYVADASDDQIFK